MHDQIVIEIGAQTMLTILSAVIVALLGIAYAAFLAWLRAKIDYGRWAWLLTAAGCTAINAAYLLATGASLEQAVLLFVFYTLGGGPVPVIRAIVEMFKQRQALTTPPEQTHGPSGE